MSSTFDRKCLYIRFDSTGNDGGGAVVYHPFFYLGILKCPFYYSHMTVLDGVHWVQRLAVDAFMTVLAWCVWLRIVL